MDPSTHGGLFWQGVSYLVEKGMLVYEPRAVATFLLENCDKLDKTQVPGTVQVEERTAYPC